MNGFDEAGCNVVLDGCVSVDGPSLAKSSPSSRMKGFRLTVGGKGLAKGFGFMESVSDFTPLVVGLSSSRDGNSSSESS